jgi:hypothetical protein
VHLFPLHIGRLDAAYLALYDAIKMLVEHANSHNGPEFEAFKPTNLFIAANATDALDALMSLGLACNMAWWRQELTLNALVLSLVSMAVQ